MILYFIFCSVFFKFLIGANGTMRKKLENETRTSISIPKQGKDGDIGKEPLKKIVILFYFFQFILKISILSISKFLF